MFNRFGLCALVLLFGASSKGIAQDRPNVVFILVDDMGYADLGCYGCKDIRTPNIDRLAKEGVRFTNFYSNAPVCTPTRAAFMTGRYQQRAGLEWAMGFTAEQYRRVGDKWVAEEDKLAFGLPTTEISLARMLKLAGYRTAAFGKWHLGYRADYNPIRHGFDEYFGVLLGHADYYTYNYFDGTPCLFENEKPATAKGYLTDLITQRAVNFIERQGNAPFFLYVPHLAVHFPFQVPDRPDQKLTKQNHNEGTRKDYAVMLEHLDRSIGQVLGALDKKGLTKNTLVMLSSDNGGYKLSDNGPLFHHKTSLWEGGVRVPCLLRWPGVLEAGKVTHQPGITMDLTATILAAARTKPPEGRKLDGIDLVPILAGKQKETERTFCWRIDRSDRRQKAVRHGDWKYIKDGMIEMLFDLKTDIGERRNLAFQHPEVLSRLRQLHADWEAEVARDKPAFVVK